MANALYDLGRGHFLDGDIDWSADNIRLVCVDEDVDVPNLATDEDLADRAAGSRVATSGNFAGKTSTDGTADANDVVLVAVVGAEFESLDIYQWTGVDATSLLICNIDTAVGLPTTPNGGNITVQWDAGANRIFTL